MSDERNDRDEKGRFLTGNGGGGRPKGSRNKLGEQFLSDLYDDWQEHGRAVIETVRAEKPDVYLKTVASILPRQIQVDNKTDMTDEQLNERIRQLADFVNFAIGSADGAGGASGREEETPRTH